MLRKIITIFILFFLLLSGFVYFYFFYSKKVTSLDSNAGILKNEIIVGSSLAKTGLISFLGNEYEIGASVYFNKINDLGGIYGRKIRLITYDDGYIPGRTIKNIQKLLVDDNVFALMNFVGSANGAKAIPMIAETGVPLVGIFSGAKILREPLHKYIFNIRPSYYEETEFFAKGAVDELKLKKIAVFHQNDDFGLDGLNGIRTALARRGLNPIVEASYNRGSLDVEAAFETIKKSNAEAVAMIATYAQAAKFISLARLNNFNPLFLCLSVVGPEEFSKTLGPDGDGVVVTQILPPPFDTDDPKYSIYAKDIINEYATDLHKYFSDVAPTFGSLEGYINALVFVEGLRGAGPEPTRLKFVNALENLSNINLGLDSNISFSRIKHQGMDRLYYTVIKDGKFVLLKNLTEISK